MYRFLLYIAHPYSIPICKPLEEELYKRGYEVRWFSELEYTKKYFEANENVLNSVQEVLAYNPQVVFTATDTVADFFPGIKVEIFHGFSANKRPLMSDHFKIRGFFDLYLTQGPSTTEIFKQQAEKYGTFEVVQTGWPKVDPLFPIEDKPATGKPVILISSTFTTRLSLAKNDDVFNEIKRLASTGKYTFLCVLHPKLEQEVKDKFISLQNENFTYFDTTNLIPLFKQADIMLSDTTSAIIEFLLQQKPVVTFCNNKPGDHLIDVTDVAKIEEAIQLALTKPEGTMAAIKDYIAWTHPYYDGKSSGRMIDAAIVFLNKDKSHLKSKPWNIVRKWKVRKLLKYYTLRSYNKPITVKADN